MKSKWLFLVLAAGMPLAALAQIAPDKPAPAENPDAGLKWQVYAGASYTSINQVNQSRYGLIGADFGVARDLGRFFAVVADGSYYPGSYASGNPGNPKVSMVLAGPEVHGPILEKWNLFGRVLLGGAHTGGTGQTPDISFAGGLGGGVEYQWRPRISFQAYGDDIASSFSLINNSPELGYSPHRLWNPRAGINVAYRF
ncbi:hypothetical protein [Terracidiphilus sp.]|uniref:hypothetical protein n=1 Tax=Terracidiphilus sp. TaxID=1964191 RepID=UPI003C15CB79